MNVKYALFGVVISSKFLSLYSVIFSSISVAFLKSAALRALARYSRNMSIAPLLKDRLTSITQTQSCDKRVSGYVFYPVLSTICLQISLVMSSSKFNISSSQCFSTTQKSVSCVYLVLSLKFYTILFVTLTAMVQSFTVTNSISYN